MFLVHPEQETRNNMNKPRRGGGEKSSFFIAECAVFMQLGRKMVTRLGRSWSPRDGPVAWWVDWDQQLHNVQIQHVM